jgi:uncharacterized membrane protein YkoI
MTENSSNDNRTAEVGETQAPAPAPKRDRKRLGLMIGGGVVAAAVLVGGGVAVGAALNREPDRIDLAGITGQAPVTSDGGSTGSSDGATSDGSAAGTPAPADGPQPASFGAPDAATLIAVADAARSVASGSVTEIDARSEGGWEVRIEDGSTEIEVRVAVDGTPTIRERDDEDDDDRPAGDLDAATLERIVEVVLPDGGGVITEVTVDDDDSRYEVHVRSNDGTRFDIDLGADFAVLSTERND